MKHAEDLVTSLAIVSQLYSSVHLRRLWEMAQPSPLLHSRHRGQLLKVARLGHADVRPQA
jgi:hypothetical protein